MKILQPRAYPWSYLNGQGLRMKSPPRFTRFTTDSPLVLPSPPTTITSQSADLNPSQRDIDSVKGEAIPREVAIMRPSNGETHHDTPQPVMSNLML